MKHIDLYRVFLWDKHSKHTKDIGGPLFVPKIFQGKGRHDIKEDGILYVSLSPYSAIAEDIKHFKNLTIANSDFTKDDTLVKALVRLTLKKDFFLIDFTNPNELLTHNVSPAHITSHKRELTQNISRKAYQAKADGFMWWSSLESTWTNVSLFNSRIKNKITVDKNIITLHTSLPELIETAKMMNVKLV